MDYAKDIMTKKVTTISPDTLLREAIDILLGHGFNGLPVIDQDGVLIGILTEFDIIVAGTSIHIPALKRSADNPDFYKGAMKEDLDRILNMKVKEVMNTEPFVLGEDAPIEEVVKAFSEHHRINPIPIVDDNRKILGLVSRYDIIKFVKSTIVELSKK